MNRIILCIAVALAAVAPTQLAWADDPAPTKEQLESAKKAFAEGKSLYDAGKFAEAVEKFKESYRLSRNALLLYNIGHTLDQAGAKDKALFYYRKFLADAPQNAAQRKEVQKRVEVIEKENLEADLAGTSTGGDSKPTPTKPSEPKPVKVKPAGTYSQTDFQHQLVDAAPPNKPLDITAFVPEDSGFSVTLYYRGAGDSKFTAKQMKWRYKELVARIPGRTVTGSSIQYYIEVKDQGGATIAKSGKSTSPNLVNIEAGATPRFYPDLADDNAGEASAADARRGDDDDPLSGRSKDVVEDDSEPRPEKPPGTGMFDAGSSSFKTMKWATTIAGGAFFVTAGLSYFFAVQQADNLKNDAYECGAPPCRPFDATYDLEVQNAGQRWNTIYQITAVASVVTLGVAGFFWYKELSSKKRGDINARKKSSSGETTWAISPTVGDNYAGATAAGRF